ncbi:MAG: branched-chain amino acid ABC transporter permease, partial [Rhodocyclales bacterium CG17_big_fil_post_rev_8_21_14_2_50_68_7]
MLSEFFQFLFSGITSGSIYALAALGFSIIFNASGVINFAQGEFIMIGGMVTVFLVKLGVPVWAAAPAAVLAAMAVGLALDKLAIEPARNAGVVALIIITIGASIFLQGIAQVLFGKGQHALPAFSGDVPLRMMGATLLPQSLWVIGVTVVIVAAMWW